jgi:hypothetical protein
VSIVQEALKKAQYNYTLKKTMPPPREGSAQDPAVLVPPEAIFMPVMIRRIAIIIYVIVLLALVTGFGIRALFFKISAMEKGKASTDMAAAKNKPVADKVVPVSAIAISQTKEALTTSIPAEPINQPPAFVLNGIMYKRENPKAIVNGVVVREGDVIGCATVTYISENNVLLKYNNNSNQVEVALRLKE